MQAYLTNLSKCCLFQPTNRSSAPLSLVKIICFCIKASFFIFFRHKREKRKKIDWKVHKITRKTCIKRGLPIFPRSRPAFGWQPAFGCQPTFKSNAGRPPLMNVFLLICCAFQSCFFLFFPFVTEKDEKTCFNAETNNFDQQSACRAPVHRSKYTTSKSRQKSILVLSKESKKKCCSTKQEHTKEVANSEMKDNKTYENLKKTF